MSNIPRLKKIDGSKQSFAQELRQLYIREQSLKVPEADYYKFRTTPPPLPTAGLVLFERKPHANFFKITWADGQSLKFMVTEGMYRRLERMGLTRPRVERGLDRIWNFAAAYIVLEPGYPDHPPQIVPEQLGSSRV